ncbi:zinc ribbon domain-containing protein [Marinifilum flexuosum]|uniref:zinc ribbon domain-containing protein n=1 Tax=Marinifilum flexuosum TaxID=1117708 RepID=UPI002494F086|nr:hypothetical protein [Marinifilum flexuosum]
MVNCKKCGKVIFSHDKFCSHCGARTESLFYSEALISTFNNPKLNSDKIKCDSSKSPTFITCPVCDGEGRIAQFFVQPHGYGYKTIERYNKDNEVNDMIIECPTCKGKKETTELAVLLSYPKILVLS